MDDPKKASLPKVVLNVTTYKEIGNVGIPMAKNIDITDILDKEGVSFSSQVNGVSEYPDREGPVYSRFVVDEKELNSLAEDINGIVDAAIVNEKQGKAIKKLIDDRFYQFSFKHWENIRSGDII